MTVYIDVTLHPKAEDVGTRWIGGQPLAIKLGDARVFVPWKDPEAIVALCDRLIEVVNEIRDDAVRHLPEKQA